MTAAKVRRCSERGCREKYYALGLCQRHYDRARRSGKLPPRQLVLGIHSLTSIDRVGKTADCSICGPQVPIRVRDRVGSGGVECRVKDKARRNRNRRGQYKRDDKYKPDQDYYDRMVADQQGLCAICQTEPRVLVVDHDHKTGAVRGLLCNKCNCGIGLLRDDVSILYSAARYLAAHNSKVPLLQPGEAAPLSA